MAFAPKPGESAGRDRAGIRSCRPLYLAAPSTPPASSLAGCGLVDGVGRRQSSDRWTETNPTREEEGRKERHFCGPRRARALQAHDARDRQLASCLLLTAHTPATLFLPSLSPGTRPVLWPARTATKCLAPKQGSQAGGGTAVRLASHTRDPATDPGGRASCNICGCGCALMKSCGVFFFLLPVPFVNWMGLDVDCDCVVSVRFVIMHQPF
jgi:hypothetical protein